MAIVIFGDNFSFPEGDASTNRVYTYAKGFTENGKKVHVVCFANDYIKTGEGQVDGIYFYHPFGQSDKHKYFLIRRWQKFLKYFKTFLLVRRINKQDKISTIIEYTMRLSSTIFAWKLSKISKSKLVIECGEHPLAHYQKGVINRKFGLFKLYIESNLSDGILCISRFLIDFYKEYGISSNKLLLTPSTVDPGRFTEVKERQFKNQYIGYFGGLTFERDNIDVLIKAFAAISDKYSDLFLVLGGFCSEKERQQIKTLILDLNIKSKVELLQYLTRQEIVGYISNAHILVMVRGNDLKSQASFPCKLTEYLSTSRPVVSVNVGEISDYLTDNFNAFLIEPGDYEKLAEKLEYILNNYELALEVAKRGKKLADTTFNYNYQAKRIIQYIENL